jgi:hypothetical protein
MNNEVVNDGVVSLGDSGVYLNSNQAADSLYRWMEETPTDVKRQQIEGIAMMMLLISATVLLILAATKQ